MFVYVDVVANVVAIGVCDDVAAVIVYGSGVGDVVCGCDVVIVIVMCVVWCGVCAIADVIDVDVDVTCVVVLDVGVWCCQSVCCCDCWDVTANHVVVSVANAVLIVIDIV